MAMVNASLAHSLKNCFPVLFPSSSSFPSISTSFFRIPPTASFSTALPSSRSRRCFFPSFAIKNEVFEAVDGSEALEERVKEPEETFLYSFSPLPLLLVAALPGAGTVRSLFGPFVELVKSWNLPDWLVHWGHPGNMEVKAKAKDLHPKLLGGMFFFFALGATGGITSLLTSDKPIFESPHAVTGFIGHALLTIQTILPALFEGNPGLRNIHGILGSSIMTLFLLHAALGLQLGLSY
ncbi:uncharacterized protein LOC105642269 isoform X3 [Jatropha curcas]|uniref:uncharacterized protein LOC105642269 isoform X3 n=1 Tax=Jatropha curcas TaxID=180498 RepID=UPI001895DD48|nr:uncharacterized protein LOC105642269 isoform X3 [Jatropha curcas]